MQVLNHTFYSDSTTLTQPSQSADELKQNNSNLTKNSNETNQESQLSKK